MNTACTVSNSTLDIDSQISSYLTNTYPSTTKSSVAWVSGYSQFQSVISSELVNAKYHQIAFTDNPLIVASFVIAAIIAIFGAIFCFYLATIVLKSFHFKYDRYLMQQKQFAITRSLTQASKEQSTLDAKLVLKDYEGR